MFFQTNITFYLAIFLFSAVVAVNGQTASNPNDEYLETVWTTEQGLPQNSVNAIIQSRDGYLWLGTFGGLARFDGIKFTTYNSGNTPGLKNNRILSLFEARDGTIWIGTQSGEVMTFKDGIGKTYTTADGLVNGFVWAIGEDSDGTVWVGNDFGISRFENGHFKTFTKDDGLPNGQTWVINHNAENQLQIAIGPNIVNFADEKLKIDSLAPIGNPNFRDFLNQPQQATDWINSIKQQTIYRKANPSLQRSPVSSLNQAIWFMEDSVGAFWAGYLWKTGMYRFEDGKILDYPTKFSSRTMIEDREHNYWVGLNGGGLMRLRRRALKTLTTENGLPNDYVGTVVDDGTGGVWIGTSEGLVHWQDGQKIRTYTTKDGLIANPVKALCLDRNGGLWIGSGPAGLTYFKDGKFKIINQEGLIIGETTALLEDKDGNIWIGTEYGLHILGDGGKQTFQKKDGLVNEAVRMLKQTSDGAIWIGTTNGLSRWKDGVFTNFTTEQGLSNDYVRDLFEDADSGLWLATYGGGLNYLKDNKITSITSRNGLFDDFLSRLLPDDDGNFWLLSNRGIFKTDRNELKDFVEGKTKSVSQISFGVADGMKSSEGAGGIQPAGWRTKDGKFWFPTIKGLVIVDPKSSNAAFAPPVVIEQIMVDRTVTPWQEKIEIYPGQENIEIAYTGLSLSRPEQIRFQYKMENLNDDWINAGTRRTAYYSYIPPGEYIFKVKANNDGIWSEETTLKIIVKPPFYRTWWFYVLTILTIVLIIFGLVRLRFIQLKRRNDAQEEFSRRLINAHEAERNRIAAELHDSIGQSLAMIKNSAIFAVHSVKDLDGAKEQFEEITNESAHAISEVREIAYNLRPYLLDRLGLTKAVNAMLNKIADKLPLRIISSIDDIDGLFENEAEISIYRIIQESLSNIIKHAEATQIKMVIEQNETQVLIKVEDNGKGFDVKAKSENKTQGGFGLMGISERVRMLNGTISIESKIGTGTTTKIELWKKQSK
ncbi:MAG: hypothetical protein K1X72_04105 [Pyrinomonadaceae bacterium]|nr:hypothetical protein [Pyrinomonadaceae bacterium]